MATAQGFNETVIIGPETTLKNPPGSPAGFKLPVANVSFKPSVDRFTSDALTGSANPRPVVDGKVACDFSFDLECSDVSLGYPLKGLFGGMSDQGVSTNYDHIFTLDTVGSWYGEQQFSDITKYFPYRGLRFGSGNFTFAPQGLMKATFGGMGCIMDAPVSSAYSTGTVTDKTGNLPFSYLYGTLKYKGAAFAVTTEVKIDVDRQLEKVLAIDGTNEAADIISKIAMLKGSLKAYVTDATLFTDALASTEVSLEMLVPHTTLGYGLKVTLPTLKLKPSAPTTNGPGGLITGEFEFDAYARGSASATAGFIGSKGFTTAAVVAGDEINVYADGSGSPVAIPLTTGASRTIAQWKADFDAVTAFNSVATCTIENGRLIIASKTTGTSSSIKLANSSGTPCTTLAFHTGAFKAGLTACAIRVILTNADSTY